MSKPLTRALEDLPDQWVSGTEIEYVKGTVSNVDHNYAQINNLTFYLAGGKSKEFPYSTWINISQVSMIINNGSGFCEN